MEKGHERSCNKTPHHTAVEVQQALCTHHQENKVPNCHQTPEARERMQFIQSQGADEFASAKLRWFKTTASCGRNNALNTVEGTLSDKDDLSPLLTRLEV
jgi:hypothetical protein